MRLKYNFKPLEASQNFFEFGRYNVQKRQKEIARQIMMTERVQPLTDFDLGDLHEPGYIVLGNPLNLTECIYMISRNGKHIIVDANQVNTALKYDVILFPNDHLAVFANYDANEGHAKVMRSVATALLNKPDDCFFYPKNGDDVDFRARNAIFLDKALGCVFYSDTSNVMHHIVKGNHYWQVTFHGRMAEAYTGKNVFNKLFPFDPDDTTDMAASKHQAEQFARDVRDEIIEKLLNDGAII